MKFSYCVIMKALWKLQLIQCNIQEPSIFISDIIFPRDHVNKGDIKVDGIGTDDQLADIFTKPLNESWFCKLRNELNIIDFSNVAWKLVHMACGSSMHLLLHFSKFSRIFWVIYRLSWFYSIYFWFLVVTRSYESLDGIHVCFEIFGFLYEQWSQIWVGIEKLAEFRLVRFLVARTVRG